jgi:uncharacterized protein with NAD-binding domain and iron-sulfur cluster
MLPKRRNSAFASPGIIFTTFCCTPKLDRPDTATAKHNLWLAGDYVAGDYPATLEGTVRSGIAAAQRVLNA